MSADWRRRRPRAAAPAAASRASARRTAVSSAGVQGRRTITTRRRERPGQARAAGGRHPHHRARRPAGAATAGRVGGRKGPTNHPDVGRRQPAGRILARIRSAALSRVSCRRPSGLRWRAACVVPRRLLKAGHGGDAGGDGAWDAAAWRAGSLLALHGVLLALRGAAGAAAAQGQGAVPAPRRAAARGGRAPVAGEHRAAGAV